MENKEYLSSPFPVFLSDSQFSDVVDKNQSRILLHGRRRTLHFEIFETVHAVGKRKHAPFANSLEAVNICTSFPSFALTPTSQYILLNSLPSRYFNVIPIVRPNHVAVLVLLDWLLVDAAGVTEVGGYPISVSHAPLSNSA